MNKEEFDTKISNVLIIGCGGAGLRAAIEVAQSGLSVKVLGKRPKNDAHTSLAAGGINAALGNIDIKDSWKQHFADTYIEGYGLGHPKIIEIMAKESIDQIYEIDNWGVNFDRNKDGLIDQRFFGAHTFRRTCYTGDSTGRSILNVLLKKAENLNISIDDSKYITDLLISDGCCFGGFGFDTITGEKSLFLSDVVIVATGGNTRIWERSSSRKDENNGDGIYLGLKAGCKLIDMEMIQFHPTGMLFPEEIAGTLVTEAVRGEGGKLFNNIGERFMSKYDPLRLELSTRDRVAMANYLEIENGRGTKNGGVFLDISHLSKNIIIKKLPTIYRQFIEYQMLDISKERMEVAPTAHYSMGGIHVSPEEHNTGIKGLFACGEVAGGLHGANRLGGNSLAELLVFGKKVGQHAVLYSKNLKNIFRCNKKIEQANNNINRRIKEGPEIARQLEKEIQKLMWKYCGVVRNQEDLLKGLSELNKIKKRSKNIDVRLTNDDFKDLTLAFNIDAAILSSEVTLLSALNREESIGSHQRSDFQNLNSEKRFNILVEMDKKNKLQITKENCPELNSDLKLIVKETKKIKNFNGKLLE